MERVIERAARALHRGEPLLALRDVALREEPPALALRGIALAQLGDLERAQTVLRRAARAYQTRDLAAHARCVLALTEVQIAARDDLRAEDLPAAIATLEQRGEHENGAYGRILSARRLLVLGRTDDAQVELERLPKRPLSPRVGAMRELVAAELAVRRLNITAAAASFARAEALAASAGLHGLSAEARTGSAGLAAPAARLISGRAERILTLSELGPALRSRALVIDGCRRVVQCGAVRVDLARRPVLFRLLRLLAEAHPGDRSRDELVEAGFGARVKNASHRVRLRVELGRLRKLLADLASIRATSAGYALAPRKGTRVELLLPLRDDQDAAVLALLADGRAWSSSALALALGVSRRQVQRILVELAQSGDIAWHGRAPMRRCSLNSRIRSATSLLLLAPGVRASFDVEVGDDEPGT